MRASITRADPRVHHPTRQSHFIGPGPVLNNHRAAWSAVLDRGLDRRTVRAGEPAEYDQRTSEVDRAAWVEQLMSEHCRPLLANAQRLLNDRSAAEDVVQETMIRAWKNADRLYSMDTSIRYWLAAVARNLSIDKLRSASHRHERVSADQVERTEADHAEGVLSAVQVTSILARLPLEQRDVLQHIYVGDKTIDETARLLGIPAGTVKSRQHYALIALRSSMVSRVDLWG